MVPAGEAAANVHTLVVNKDPADPTYAEDPAMQQYLADVEHVRRRTSIRRSATRSPGTTPGS